MRRVASPNLQPQRPASPDVGEGHNDGIGHGDVGHGPEPELRDGLGRVAG